MKRSSFRATLVFALAAHAAGSGVAIAQQPAAGSIPVITAAGSAVHDVVPGKTATIVFSVVGTGNRPVDYRTAVILPPGWRALSGSGALTLRPRAPETILVLVAVPVLAVPGRHAIELRINDPANASRIFARRVSHAIVAAHPRVELVPVDAPEFVAAGTQYQATFLLRNTGNAGVAVRLHARGYPDFPTKIDSVSFLRAGEARTVRASVSTRLTDRSSLAHRLYLTVKLGVSDTAVVAKAQSGVLVVARAGDHQTGDYSIPAQLRIIGGGRVNSAHGNALAFELAGRGALSDGGATRIDFLARRSQSPFLPFALRDEYRFQLASPSYDIRLGQQVFVLTSLTREGRSGSGASARMRMGALTLGGFHGDDRWDPVTNRARAIQGRPENGAFAELSPVRALTIGGNYLSSSEFPGGDLWTARLRFDPHSLVKINIESGAGLGATADQRGTLVSASGTSRFVSYYVRHEQADTGFTGTRPGASATQGHVAFRPIWRLELSAAARNQTMSNPSLTRTANVRGWSRERDAGISIPGAALTYRSMARDFGESRVAGVFETLALRLTPRLSFLTLDAEMERGALRQVDGVVQPVESVRLRSGVAGGFGGSISAFVRRDTGPWRYAALDGIRWSEGVNAALRTRHGFLLEVFGTRVRDSTSLAKTTSSMIDGVAGFTSRRGYSADVRWRAVTSGTAALYPEVQASLTIPLGIPARRSRSLARVTGRVYDIETGRGVPNALVMLGDQAVLTDRAGRLDFGAVRPDSYNLQLEPGSVAGGRVPLSGTANMVKASAGKTSRIDLGIGRGARITGRVRLYAPADPLRWSGGMDQVADTGGLAGVVVTLINGDQSLRRVTGGDGSFEIGDVRPGRWTASVAAEDLPPLHHVASQSTPITVVAGETGAIEIRVLPRKRTLRIVDGDGVTATPIVTSSPRAAVVTTTGPAPAAIPARVPPLRSSARRRAVPPPVYSVQVGNYKLRSGAEYLAASLRRHRVQAFVVRVAGSYSVAVGRYLSLREADTALAGIRRQGRMDGVVVRLPDR